MPNTRYRRGRHYAADMAVYSRQMAGDNSRELSRLKRNLIRALQEDVTEKQRTALLLYYAEGYNMREIGEKLGVETESWFYCNPMGSFFRDNSQYSYVEIYIPVK